MRRLGVGAMAIAALALGLSTKDAHATKPCPSVDRQGVKVKVATNRVDCEVGQGVVEGFYGLLDAGKVKSQHTQVAGFRCAGGLAFSELFCNRGSLRWVFASSRPEDDPATWEPPGKPRPGRLPAHICDSTGCGHIRPRALYFDQALGSPFWITRIKWQQWQPSGAIGEGWLHYDTCRPNCADGRYRVVRTLVTLDRIHRCRGHRVYREMDVSPGSLPTEENYINCSGIVVKTVQEI